MALPHGAVGWSAVCDCDISRSYSLFYSLRYLSTLYSHPDWPEKSPSQLRQELRESIKSTPLWLLNPASIYRYLSRIIAKRSQGQPVSFTDFFGHLVGETLLQGVSTCSFNLLKSQPHLQQTTNILISFLILGGKEVLIFHLNHLPADDHKKYQALFSISKHDKIWKCYLLQFLVIVAEVDILTTHINKMLTNQSVHTLQTQSMHVDEDRPQCRPVALLNTTAWAFTGGFWAFTKTLCACPYVHCISVLVRYCNPW